MRLSFDVVVLGAGVAGLMSAHRLSALGYRVAVIDPAPRVLSGATSRNEGWIHAGTYHAQSIRDRNEAIQVATRCLSGWKTYTTEFRDCIEPEPAPAIAIVRDEGLEAALERWDAAQVHYEPLSTRKMHDLGAVAIREDERPFAVADRSINVSMLGARLHQLIHGAGGTFLLGARPSRLDDHTLTVETKDGVVTIDHEVLVLATGYGTTEACSSLEIPAPTIRLWQSHLLILPRLAHASVFSVHPQEAAMANHGEWSVVGLNEDARLVDEPEFTPTDEGTSSLRSAVQERFPSADFSKGHVVACVKVDVAGTVDASRSLNISLDWLRENVISILPGKMTEAPWAVDALVHEVFAHLNNSVSTPRPLDVHRAKYLETAQ